MSEWVRQLEARSLSYKMEKQSAPQADRPPFDMTVVTVPRFLLMGDRGELQVEFFNNRLTAVRFFPEEPDRVLGRLAESGVDLRSKPESATGPHARAWCAVDNLQRRYIGWEDTRLRKEVDLWIRRYS